MNLLLGILAVVISVVFLVIVADKLVQGYYRDKHFSKIKALVGSIRVRRRELSRIQEFRPTLVIDDHRTADNVHDLNKVIALENLYDQLDKLLTEGWDNDKGGRT